MFRLFMPKIKNCGDSLRWIIDFYRKENPNEVIWLKSEILGTTVQIYVLESGIVRFSEPFGSMQFLMDLRRDKIEVKDSSRKSTIWHELTEGCTSGLGIDNPQMEACLRTLRACALEQTVLVADEPIAFLNLGRKETT